MLAKLREKIISLDLDPVDRHKALFHVEALAITSNEKQLEHLLDLLEALL